jgi:hypothetical protein
VPDTSVCAALIQKKRVEGAQFGDTAAMMHYLQIEMPVAYRNGMAMILP